MSAYKKASDHFQKDDKVRVISEDSREFGHGWPLGKELVLIHFDPSDDSWWCSDTEIDRNWIGEEDIEILVEVTEQDIKAAIQSILGKT